MLNVQFSMLRYMPNNEQEDEECDATNAEQTFKCW